MKTLTTIFATIVLTLGLGVSAEAQVAGFTKLGGETFDFDSQQGKVVVVAIGVRWLPLSKNQAAALNKLSAKYDPSKVAFFFVFTDTTSGPPQDLSTDIQLETFAKANSLTATLLRDPHGIASVKLFKPDQLPAFVVIGKDGKMVDDAITGLDPKTDISPAVALRIERALGK